MGWDSNPRYPCGHAGFQDRCLKPLGHPSHQLINLDFSLAASGLKTPLLPKLLSNALNDRRPKEYQDCPKLARAALIAAAACHHAPSPPPGCARHRGCVQ
jgi:hypothetical protein